MKSYWWTAFPNAFSYNIATAKNAANLAARPDDGGEWIVLTQKRTKMGRALASKDSIDTAPIIKAYRSVLDEYQAVVSQPDENFFRKFTQLDLWNSGLYNYGLARGLNKDGADTIAHQFNQKHIPTRIAFRPQKYQHKNALTSVIARAGKVAELIWARSILLTFSPLQSLFYCRWRQNYSDVAVASLLATPQTHLLHAQQAL